MGQAEQRCSRWNGADSDRYRKRLQSYNPVTQRATKSVENTDGRERFLHDLGRDYARPFFAPHRSFDFVRHCRKSQVTGPISRLGGLLGANRDDLPQLLRACT
jgi:hypothetical protein